MKGSLKNNENDILSYKCVKTRYNMDEDKETRSSKQKISDRKLK